MEDTYSENNNTAPNEDLGGKNTKQIPPEGLKVNDQFRELLAQNYQHDKNIINKRNLLQTAELDSKIRHHQTQKFLTTCAISIVVLFYVLFIFSAFEKSLDWLFVSKNFYFSIAVFPVEQGMTPLLLVMASVPTIILVCLLKMFSTDSRINKDNEMNSIPIDFVKDLLKPDN